MPCTVLLAVGTIATPVAASERRVQGIPGTVAPSADPDLAAWQRLQYGMFIHWGIYSELGDVWQGRPVSEGYSEQIQMWATISEADYLDDASGRYVRVQLESTSDPLSLTELVVRATG